MRPNPGRSTPYECWPVFSHKTRRTDGIDGAQESLSVHHTQATETEEAGGGDGGKRWRDELQTNTEEM